MTRTNLISESIEIHKKISEVSFECDTGGTLYTYVF